VDDHVVQAYPLGKIGILEMKEMKSESSFQGIK